MTPIIKSTIGNIMKINNPSVHAVARLTSNLYRITKFEFTTKELAPNINKYGGKCSHFSSGTKVNMTLMKKQSPENRSNAEIVNFSIV